MFERTRQGPVEVLFIHLDQVWDEEGPLGKLLNHSQGAVSRNLSTLRDLLRRDTSKHLKRAISPDYKLQVLDRIDPLIEAVSTSRSQETENAERRKVLDDGLEALRRLRLEVLKLPFWENLPKRQALQEARAAQRKRDWIGYFRVIIAAAALAGIGLGLLRLGFQDLAVFLGIPMALFTFVGAWAFASGRTFLSSLRSLWNRIVGPSAMKTYLSQTHVDQMEVGSFSIGESFRQMDFDQRYQFVKRWAHDFHINIGQNEFAWFACKDNFARFLGLREYVGSHRERQRLGRIMKAEREMMRWAQEPMVKPCVCRPAIREEQPCERSEEAPLREEANPQPRQSYQEEEAEVAAMAIAAGAVTGASFLGDTAETQAGTVESASEPPLFELEEEEADASMVPGEEFEDSFEDDESSTDFEDEIEQESEFAETPIVNQTQEEQEAPVEPEDAFEDDESSMGFENELEAEAKPDEPPLLENEQEDQEPLVESEDEFEEEFEDSFEDEDDWSDENDATSTETMSLVDEPSTPSEISAPSPSMAPDLGSPPEQAPPIGSEEAQDTASDEDDDLEWEDDDDEWEYEEVEVEEEDEDEKTPDPGI